MPIAQFKFARCGCTAMVIQFDTFGALLVWQNQLSRSGYANASRSAPRKSNRHLLRLWQNGALGIWANVGVPIAYGRGRGCLGKKREQKVKIKSLLGEKFGRMVVIGEPEQGLHKRVIARCDCGNELLVQAGHLRSGHTSSCGCAKRERFTKFGIAAKSLYTMHTCMVNRCTNPNHDTYKYYGGRGIQVCAEWSGERGSWHFAEWSIANGYQAGLQIDRIDSNGDYSPDNCRFVTRRENANNCRDTVFIDFNGVSMPTSYAAERAGINYKTLKTRLHRGWSADRALTHPVRKLRQADGSRAK